jgi:GT2 family glycosyltransferase
MGLEQNQISEKGFWLTNDESGHCFDLPLAEQLRNLFKHHKVIDLGCGPGYYTKYFLENGIECEGWDGNPNTPELSNGLCNVADLTQPQSFENKNWVLSLEVGEHIPKEYEDVFINNITKHATEGVVLSWATPGQPGDGHVNCQSNEYVVALLEKHGFVLDTAMTVRMREAAELWWFQNTVMCFRKNFIPKITFCIPSKSNLRYLKTCIPSIRENAYRDDHDIVVFVDSDEDGTVEWLKSVAEEYNVKYYVNPNLGSSLYGIGKAYDFCIDKAETDVFMVFHADMMLGKWADLKAYQCLTGNSAVCSTRVEPPLHPNNGEKILIDFGLWPEEFKKSDFNSYVEDNLNNQQVTQGIFAPWMMYKKDFQELGGHDEILRSCREDSDVFNRMKLKGFTFTQPWNSLVYHLTGRGAGSFEGDPDRHAAWKREMDNSTKDFIRKWGSNVNHTPLMDPIVAPKYSIGYVVHNCDLNILTAVEPWCSNVYIKDDKVCSNYIAKEQSNTAYNLKNRIRPNSFSSSSSDKPNDIIVEFDGTKLTNENFQLLQQLPLIIKETNEVGQFEIDIFTITIKDLTEYQNELIHIYK